ncbi:sialidase family protein [uncultured Enterococcus sp.]|uniref:sialidase family protein n=1 Tax=uncultured Enterococcus sp. TaxID=167972 RepID=UPI002AA8F7D8|nr:sialidase family protein [uncultured Enterococcus sp.]
MRNKPFNSKKNKGFFTGRTLHSLKQIPVGVRTGAVIVVAGLALGAYHAGKNTALAEEAAAPAINVTSSAEKKASLEGTKIRRNNNKWQFSSDDGDTWSETPPEGIYEGDDGRLYYESDKIKGMNSKSEGEIAEFPFGDEAGNNVIMKRENDSWQFSSDGGRTWTDEAPEGVDIAKDGTVTWQSEDGKQVSEFDPSNGKWRYSEDGGKTWSDPLKDIEDWIENGFTMSVAEGILMKLQDGKVVYSTDGGETWSEEVPEGLEVPENSVIAKGEDGKMKYSTDGGKTWSEEKPEGFEIPTVEDILESLPEGLIPSLDETEDSDGLDANATSL